MELDPNMYTTEDLAKKTECVFETAREKDFVYSITKNEHFDEIVTMIKKNDTLLNSSLVHKLNIMLKNVHLIRKMEFGAQLIITFAPILWMGVALYMIIDPDDVMDIIDKEGNPYEIKFNTGAIIFANILQIFIWLVFTIHGCLGIYLLKIDPEIAVKSLDYLIITNAVPVLIIFWVYSLIRITVYTVGVEDWMKKMTKIIDHKQTFNVHMERNFDLSPHMTLQEGMLTL